MGLQPFIGTKVIGAEPMTNERFSVHAHRAPSMKHEPQAEGYRVVYPGGYESWSPKEVFEQAYRPVTKDEQVIVNLKEPGQPEEGL